MAAQLRGCRRSSRATCSITARRGACSRTWSPASASARTIDEAGFLKERHADRFLKAPAEMARLFQRYPEALARTREMPTRCTLLARRADLQLPDGRRSDGLTAQERLEKLTWEGAARRYPEACRTMSRRSCGTSST